MSDDDQATLRFLCCGCQGSREYDLMKILLTGSSGLVGRNLSRALVSRGVQLRHFDVARSPLENVRNAVSCNSAVTGVDGIVHLAAISRVITAEKDPTVCQAVNIEGLRTLLAAAVDADKKPWFLFVSSREVYGDSQQFPVSEDASYAPRNHYARSKVFGERLTYEARERGVCANIARLSTVYGDLDDYPDRVLPAFCIAAARGAELQVQGADVILDAVHVHDAAEGLARLMSRTAGGDRLPPIHFVSGRGTTLRQMADIAVAAAESRSTVIESAPRDYGVRAFIGDPTRAEQILGWTALTMVSHGIRDLVQAFRAQHDSTVPKLLVAR
jgi:nucleoside-diphosphate-sugar epimerase